MVLIDCCLVNSAMRGMGRFSFFLSRELIQQEEGMPCFFLVNSIYGYKKIKSFLTRSGYSHKLIYIPIPQPLVEQLVIPFICFYFKIRIYVSGGDSISLLARAKQKIYLLHDIYFLKEQKRAEGIKQRIGVWYRALCFRFSGEDLNVVTVSRHTASEIAEVMSDRNVVVDVVPNPIELAGSFTERNSTRDIDILFVSGLNPQKNLSWALTTLVKSRLLEKYQLNVAVVGVESAKEAGVEANSRVKFHGFVSNDAIQRYYKTAQIFVLPSRDESFGVPILEALLHGCRVVTSDAGALPEVLNGFGRMFQLDSQVDFLSALELEILNPFVCDKKRLDHYLSRFESEAVFQKFLKLLLVEPQ